MDNVVQYDSLDIARHLIFLCKDQNISDINNTKINKLLYAVYGIYLAVCDREILKEQPKYFPYGPVFPRVYTKFEKLEPIEYVLDEELNKVIYFVMNTFAKKSAGKLSNWSHDSGSPWDNMRQKNAKYSDSLNPIEVRDYFRNFLKP